jgi:hypothetical protein
MSPPRPASSYALTARGARTLYDLVRSERQRVSDQLAAAAGGKAVSCLAFLFAEEELPSVSYAYAWTETARQKAFRDGTEAGLRRLWDPAGWDIADFVDTLEDYTLVDQLAEALDAAGCEGPEPAFLMDLAHAINRSRPAHQVTTDFACWALPHDLGDAPQQWLAAVATDSIIKTYESRGWMRAPRWT